MPDSSITIPQNKDPDLAALMRQATNGVVPADILSKQSASSSVVELPESSNTDTIDPPPKNTKKSRQKRSKSETSVEDSGADDHYTWQRFTFICDKVIVTKLHDIASKEGFHVSAVMQLMLSKGIEAYEQKHGPVKHSDKSLDSLL